MHKPKNETVPRWMVIAIVIGFFIVVVLPCLILGVVRG